jgi:hypothetical protein
MTDTQTPRRRRRKPNTELTRQSVSSPIGEVRRRLAEEEEHIDRAIGTGFAAMIEVVNRLAVIRDQGLYRDDFDLFEDYLNDFDKRTGIKPKTLYRLMDAAPTIRKLDEGLRLRKHLPADRSVVGTFVRNEWQARLLKSQIATVLNAADITTGVRKGLANARRELEKKEQQKRNQRELTGRAAVDASGAPKASSNDHSDPNDLEPDVYTRMADGSGQVKLGSLEWSPSDSGKIMPVTHTPDGHALLGDRLPKHYAERMMPTARTVKELQDWLTDQRPTDGVRLYADHLLVVGDSGGAGIAIPLGYDSEDEA